MSNTVDIDEALDLIGFGRMQYLMFFACILQVMYVANEQFSISLIVVAASCDINIEAHRMGWLVAFVFAGQVLTSLFMGYQSDEIGRRKLLLITAFSSMTLSFLGSLMPEYWSFAVTRFFLGCSITGPGMAALTYMSEFTKISMRPQVINFLFYSNGISLMYVAIIAKLLNPLNIRWRIFKGYDITSWRLQMWAVLVPGIISCAVFALLPESAKFYLSIDKPEEAYDVLQKCYRYNKGPDSDLSAEGIASVSQNVLRPRYEHTKKNSFCRMFMETKPLFQRPNVKHMVILLVVILMLFSTGVGLTVWIPRILEMRKEIKNDVILCDLISYSKESKINSTLPIPSNFRDRKCLLSIETLLASLLLGACCLCFSILISILIFWIDRKAVLIFSSIFGVCAGLSLNFVKFDLLVIACCIFLSVPPLCSLRLALTIVVDVIPTHLRSKALSLSFMCGRMGALMTALYVGYMMQKHCFVTFNTFVVMLTGSIVLICFLTRNAMAGSRIDLTVKTPAA